MHKVTSPIWLILFLLIITISACGGSPAPTSLPVENSDAATAITATTETRPITQDTATNPPPTETPIPTETPEPTDDKEAPALDTPTSDLQVVYTHEGNLWLWRSDQTQTQLTDSYEAFAPKISPDGRLVAYLKGWDIYNAELWVMNIDGSEKRSLVSKDDLAAIIRDETAVGTMIGAFDWIPGQRTLAYNTIQLFEVPSSPQNNDLRLVNADTGSQTLLLEPGLGGKFTYSPDGSQIALVTPESLSITNADGSNRRDILTFPVIFTNGGWNYYPQPVWAPDSGHLRVAIPPQDPLNNPGAFTFVWHIPADGSMPHMAGEFVSIPVYASIPLISPDTNKVIFLAAIGEAFDILELCLLDLTDGSQEALYAGNISLHNWNPDAVRFVFSQDFGADFYIGQSNTYPDNIADVPVSKNLVWVSPEQFIFTSGEYENRELRIGIHDNPSLIIAQPFGETFTFDFYPKP